MAFLDNSGDIILDAVLTETGRRRMAQGNFKIAKFALSDEEINYALYNYNHSSGSAYYDLEILQTPILEAGTNIDQHTGLRSLTNLNILYMPDLLQNQKLTTAVKRKNNTIYVAVNTETYSKINTELGTAGSCIRAGDTSGVYAIALESAINNSDVLATLSNQQSYITSMNMLDTSQTITFDTNFVRYPITSTSTATWSNDAEGNWGGSLGTLTARTTVSPSDRDGFGTSNAPMNRASIFLPTGGSSETVSTWVNSAGVVGSMNAVNIEIPEELKTVAGQTADPRWSKFGTVTVTPAGGFTSNYSIIPTSLEVIAASSGATLDIPITLIKYDS